MCKCLHTTCMADGFQSKPYMAALGSKCTAANTTLQCSCISKSFHLQPVTFFPQTKISKIINELGNYLHSHITNFKQVMIKKEACDIHIQIYRNIIHRNIFIKFKATKWNKYFVVIHTHAGMRAHIHTYIQANIECQYIILCKTMTSNWAWKVLIITEIVNYTFHEQVINISNSWLQMCWPPGITPHYQFYPEGNLLISHLHPNICSAWQPSTPTLLLIQRGRESFPCDFQFTKWLAAGNLQHNEA